MVVGEGYVSCSHSNLICMEFDLWQQPLCYDFILSDDKELPTIISFNQQDISDVVFNGL